MIRTIRALALTLAAGLATVPLGCGDGETVDSAKMAPATPPAGGAMGKMEGGAMGKMETGKMETGKMETGKMEAGKMEPK